MTAWQIFMAFLSVAFFVAIFWPAISTRLAKVWAWLRSGNSGTVTPPPAGATVSAEQAQAAELVMARFLAQTDDGPVRDLICNGIKTLAEKIK